MNLFQHPWAKWMQILLCTMGWLLLLNTLVLFGVIA